MSTKEKIVVYAVENNLRALETLEEIFKDNESYELHTIKTPGNGSTQTEKPKKEVKELVMKPLTEETYHILILDLLLRDGAKKNQEKIVGENFSGIENVLSLEIARQLKQDFPQKDFLTVFTSSSEICSTHQIFEEIREKHMDMVPKDAVFIFKPEEKLEHKFRNCPVFSASNAPACKKKKKDAGGCSQKTCFLALLDKYYEEYLEKQGDD